MPKPLTYDSAAEADADRAQQRELLTALGAWDRALRRDECGAWCICGQHGNILTWGDGRTWVEVSAETLTRLTHCASLAAEAARSASSAIALRGRRADATRLKERPQYSNRVSLFAQASAK
jgi:hypothetical protein